MALMHASLLQAGQSHGHSVATSESCRAALGAAFSIPISLFDLLFPDESKLRVQHADPLAMHSRGDAVRASNLESNKVCARWPMQPRRKITLFLEPSIPLAPVQHSLVQWPSHMPATWPGGAFVPAVMSVPSEFVQHHHLDRPPPGLADETTIIPELALHESEEGQVSVPLVAPQAVDRDGLVSHFGEVPVSRPAEVPVPRPIDEIVNAPVTSLHESEHRTSDEPDAEFVAVPKVVMNSLICQRWLLMFILLALDLVCHTSGLLHAVPSSAGASHESIRGSRFVQLPWRPGGVKILKTCCEPPGRKKSGKDVLLRPGGGQKQKKHVSSAAWREEQSTRGGGRLVGKLGSSMDTVNIVQGERVHSLAVPVPQTVEEIVNVPRITLQVAVVNHTVEMIMDVPVRQIVEVIAKVPELPKSAAEIDNVPKITLHELVMNFGVERIMDVPVHQIVQVPVMNFSDVLHMVQFASNLSSEMNMDIPMQHIAKEIANVPQVILHELVMNRSVEPIVDVPRQPPVEELVSVPKIVAQEIAQVPKIDLQEFVMNRGVEMVMAEFAKNLSVEMNMDVPVHQTVQEIVYVPKAVQQQFVRYRSVEPIMDVPVHQTVVEIDNEPKFVEQESVKVPKIAPQEYVMNPCVDLNVEVSGHQTVQEIVRVPKVIPHESVMNVGVEMIVDVPVQQHAQKMVMVPESALQEVIVEPCLITSVFELVSYSVDLFLAVIAFGFLCAWWLVFFAKVASSSSSAWGSQCLSCQ